MTHELQFGRLRASVSDVVDTGIDVLPNYEMAAITMIDSVEHPGEFPEIRRRLRGEGLRATAHRGVLLVSPADLEKAVSAGLLPGADELYLLEEWNDEFEPFPGHVANEDFLKGTSLGLDEWMVDAGCVLAIGDGAGVNFATYDDGLAARLRARFPAPKP